MNNQRLISIISSLLLVVLPLVFSSWITWFVVSNEQAINQLNTQQWLLISVICCITSALAFTPPTFLALVFGYFLGWTSLPLLFFINMLAIFLVNVGFKISKVTFNETILGPKAMQLMQQIKTEELKIIFFTKLSPILPFALTNVVFALSGARTRNIMLGGFLGMIPRTVLAVWSSMQFKSIKSLLQSPNASNLSQIVLIVLFVLSIVGLYSVLQRKIGKKIG